jgi:CRISPR-associated protein (TIGR02584 family)
MAAKPYNLIALAGETPQVVTETVWALACRDRFPSQVTILTTVLGEAFCRAKLLGETVRHPRQGGLIEPADHWAKLFEQFGRSYTPEIRFIVPDISGRPLSDISAPGEDEVFAEACFDAVADLTGEDDLPLVGSMAGGRKTMSAHLHTAFSVNARPTDELVHVLVHPPSYERGDFFYPTPQLDGKVEVRLVSVRFPRLRDLMIKHLGDGEGPPDLAAIFASTEPWFEPSNPPAQVTLRPHGRACEVIVTDDGGEVISEGKLSAKNAATLAVMLELTMSSRDGARPAAFFRSSDPETHRVTQLRNAVAGYCGMSELTPWVRWADVSKARHDLNSQTVKDPALAALLSFPKETGTIDHIAWRPSHDVDVVVQIDDDPEWPF